MKQLGIPLNFWGYEVVGKLGIITSPEMKPGEETSGKQGIKIKKAAEKFYNAIKTDRLVKPNFISVAAFQLQKEAFGNAEKDSADYLYWKDKGWLDKRTGYYCPARIGLIKMGAACLIAKLVIRQATKPFAKKDDSFSA